MKTRRQKRTLTLLEIMIVIVLIGLIGSVIGFNMKGSLDEGRAFKTKKAKEQLQDILMLEVARGTPIGDVIKDRKTYLKNSGLVKNPDDLLKDGWGHEFEVKIDGRSNEKIMASSEKLKQYERKKNEKLGKTVVEIEEEDD
jgi:general secretion pathway protein G